MKSIVYKKRANAFFIKIVIVSLFFLAVSAFFIFISHTMSISSKRNSPASRSTFPSVTVVIDAGHGGIDGGAEANGVFEKTLNLSVSKKIADFLSFYKVDCVLTRYDDVLLNDEGSTHKKQSDLLNRTIITKSFESPIFVSIHMNKFPVEKYCGLQVFYSQNNPDSKIIADAIQENTVTYIQKNNNRKTKPAGSSIFVLDRLECPAVLIECGFMSNSNELNQLTDDNYQMELAYIISTSIINYLKEL